MSNPYGKFLDSINTFFKITEPKRNDALTENEKKGKGEGQIRSSLVTGYLFVALFVFLVYKTIHSHEHKMNVEVVIIED